VTLYKGIGNIPAADSVYQLVSTRYPKSPQAATGLYKHGMILWDANKRPEARIVFNRVIKEYPSSPEAELASDRLRPRE
jgi:TolA-binding protein